MERAEPPCRPILVMWFLLAIPVVAIAADLPDARELVRRSALRDAEELQQRRSFTYIRRTNEKKFDGSKVTSTETRAWDVTNLYGRAYSRLVEKDGKPLAPAEAQREQEKMDRELAKRRGETGADRARRAEKEKRELEQERRLREEVAEAFEFRILGDDAVSGIPAWVIEAIPRPGFRPRSREASIFPKVKGKLWITKDDRRWARVEAEFLDTFSMGWFLFRVNKGTRVSVEVARVQNVWMPRRIYFRGQARVAGLKKFDLEEETLYENYRRFQTESRVVD